MLSSENTVLVDGMLSWEVIGERVVIIMSFLELLEIFIDVVLFGEVVEIFVIVVVLLSVGVAGMRVVVVMLSMEVAGISLVMIVGEVDVRILVIDVRPSTDVLVVFCEAGLVFGEVAGVLLIVKLSVELPLDVVELICGVVIVCCVVIICSGVVLIPGDVIFCTGIL